VTVDRYQLDGVAVDHYRPATPNGRPPVVLVHGGAHGAWTWALPAAHLATRGWDCHVFDWFDHGSSTAQPANAFVSRSIVDVLREIRIVSAPLGEFHLVGHSMGGLAALHAATVLTPASLVLVTPVVPAEVGAPEIPVPVDLTQPFAVPPFEVAKGMFFPTMTDEEARRYHALLTPESSRAVYEATRWTVSVDLAKVTAPTMVIGAGADTLTPPAAVRGLATLLGCRYVEHPDVGHSDVLLKTGGWQPVATDIERWLATSGD
jgi:non-heme chloroperoxidase